MFPLGNKTLSKPCLASMSRFVRWLLKWVRFNLQAVCSFCMSPGPGLRDCTHLLEVSYTLWESELKIIAASSNKTIGNPSYYSPVGKLLPVMFQSHAMGRYHVLLFSQVCGFIASQMVASAHGGRVVVVAYDLNPCWGVLTLNSQPDLHQLDFPELPLVPNILLCSDQATLLPMPCVWLANFNTYCSES